MAEPEGSVDHDHAEVPSIAVSPALASQPFLRLRRTVARTATSVFGHSLLPVDTSVLVPISEADPRRLAAGFDFGVPCAPLAKALGTGPDLVAQRLAEALGGLSEPGCLAEVAAEGQYLNLRLDRSAFGRAVAQAAAAGILGRCEHSPETREDFCLVEDERLRTELRLRLVATLAENCCGHPPDLLPGSSAEAEGLVERLVRAGSAEPDRSGLTSAVMMGVLGDRFLVRSPAGGPTETALMASRILASEGRPVLLVVRGRSLDLVRRIETVVEATEPVQVEVRPISIDERWSELFRLVWPSPADAEAEAEVDIRAGVDIRDVAARVPVVAELPELDDRHFAVVRHLARLPDVSHRTLATGDPSQMLRFVTQAHRRLDDAERSREEGAPELRSLVEQALDLSATRPDLELHR